MGNTFFKLYEEYIADITTTFEQAQKLDKDNPIFIVQRVARTLGYTQPEVDVTAVAEGELTPEKIACALSKSIPQSETSLEVTLERIAYALSKLVTHDVASLMRCTRVEIEATKIPAGKLTPHKIAEALSRHPTLSSKYWTSPVPPPERTRLVDNTPARPV